MSVEFSETLQKISQYRSGVKRRLIQSFCIVCQAKIGQFWLFCRNRPFVFALFGTFGKATEWIFVSIRNRLAHPISIEIDAIEAY